MPDEDNYLIWYFLIKGSPDTEYACGYYLGKVLHTQEYPDTPPDFIMLTPNGRFMVDHKICISSSGYHSNEWSPTLNINAILLGFLSIWLDDKEHGVSHIFEPTEKRKLHALNSIEHNKKYFSKIISRFTRFLDEKGYPIIELKEIKQKELLIEKKEVIKNIDKFIDDSVIEEKPAKKKEVITEIDEFVIEEKPAIEVNKLLNYECPNCRKKYIRKSAYDKHIMKC
jgi:ubiquitin-protein ligase